MSGIQVTDFIVLFLYFIGIIWIGVRTAKKIKTVGNYFMPRTFGKSALIMHAFGTGTHSDQAVSVSSKTFTNGLSGIWYQWLWLFATPFYWLIAPIMRRFRAITTADVFVARFNPSVGMLYAMVGMLNLMVNIGVMLKGSSAVISSVFSGAISADMVIAIMTIMFLVYGIAGGLSAAIITDFIQGVLTVIFSFILLPFVMKAVGGIHGLHQAISDPQMFSLVAPAEIGVFYVLVIAINGLIGIVTQPHTMGNCAAGKTELDGRIGFTVGNFIKRICTVAWSLTGLAAVAYFAGQNVNPDNVFGLMAKEFLPQIMPGLLGVFLASLLASVMSSCDSFMIASSALFTENIYKPLQKNKTEKHYLKVGRIISLFIVLGGVSFAYWLPGVIKGLEIFWKIPPMMGLVFWLGLFWRRTTATGAWATTLVAFFTWWLTTTTMFIEFMGSLSSSENLRFVIEKSTGPEIYLPWQMVFYLSAGLLAGIVVSLLTKPEKEEKLEQFYEVVRTPVEKGEPESEAPCRLPIGINPAPRKNMFPNTNIEIQVPSVLSMTGFLLSWLLVIGLIFVFFTIAKG
ncbi:MAG: sodium:solute symporter family protein [Candidatus Marinimicrobia bacterium]|nr:sodium:solute symporter family protein [Candidatus Neomarinimicrobiota bacterium]